MKHALLTLIAALCANGVAGADVCTDFLVAPGVSVSPAPTRVVFPEAVSAAEKQAAEALKQYHCGLADYLSVLDAEMSLLQLRWKNPHLNAAEREALLTALRSADAKRTALLEARNKNKAISPGEYFSSSFLAAWDRAEWDNTPLNLERVAEAADKLNACVQELLKMGMAERAQCLVAAITCGEAKLRLPADDASLREQAAAVQKLYDELAVLLEERSKEQLGVSPTQALEAALAARSFERECAAHLYRDAAAAQRSDTAIADLFELLREQYAIALVQGQADQAAAERVESRMADEVLRKKSSSAPERTPMIQRIIALPDNSFYEESKASLAERLYAGEYWRANSEQGDTEYLKIGGDGCRGQRLFILTARGNLYLLEEDWENGETTDSLMMYQSEREAWKTCCDAVPKSVLETEPLSSVPSLLQPWLQSAGR